MVVQVRCQHMVKTLAFHGAIEFAPPQDVFKFLYEDDAFTKWYHQEVNQDQNASATFWSEDGRREVRFRPRLSALPRFLRSSAGDNLPQVKEIQKYIRNGNVFTILSELPIDVMGATAVITGETKLSPDGKGGCAVDVNFTLDVKSAVQGVVETYVEKDAESSFKRWMNIARVFCEEKMGLEKEHLLEDEFFDVSDTALDDVLPPAGQAPAADPQNSSSPRPTQSPSLLQVLSRLKSLDAKFLKLERDLFSLRSSLEGHPLFTLKFWGIYGLGIVSGLALGLLYLSKRLNRR